MNSGKVRIYELSKELNLDNKDILVVCEQLNISVKSHSSTITDSEAEQIRAAAEKYSASHPSSAKTRQGHATPPESKSRVPAPIQKKQQILEIRKPVTRQVQSPEPPVHPSATTSQQAVVSPSAQLITKPAIPSRPTRPGENSVQVEQPSTPDSLIPQLDRSIQPEQPADQTDSLQDDTVLAEVVAVVEESVATVEESVATVEESVDPLNQPELVSPPLRPALATSASKASLPHRPVLKRSQAEQQPSTASVKKPLPDRNTSAPGIVERSSLPPTKPSPGSKQAFPSKPEGRVAPRPQQIVELRRPAIRPTTGGAADGTSSPRGDIREGVGEVPILRLNRPQPTSADPVVTPAVVGADGLQLNRPTLPRSKKAKGWKEEEEDVQEFPEKAVSKVSPKGKRRAQPSLDDEDEEDLDGVLDNNPDSPVQVSLSLVRPAKPKATRPAQIKVATAAPKAKKFAPARDRRDRREEVKQEKPEKITLVSSLTVQELALLLLVPETEIIRTLFFKGIAANITQTLDIPTATMVAQEFGIEVETGQKEAEARKVTEMLDAADLESLQRRPPVVTIMGHVDHGKTTLLDSIRKTKVAQGEAGGITQHIGAYHVDVSHDGQTQQVVFLDTPGHEAFTAMRARGARVTDIAILVVAADDGVRPQTIEAISHAKAAEVPIIVAINKVDKEEAQPERVKQELTEFGLVSEEWGGETIMVPVSALTGENLDTLLEMILLVAEIEELHANPDRCARGTVIEAHLDKAKGPVATLLIQNGTLQVGNTLVAGSVLGKVRALMDDRGQRVKTASPSFAVEVLGLNDVPAAGDEFEVFQDEKEARSLAETRSEAQRQSRLLQAMSSRRVSLNTLSARAQEGELKELNLVLKADVQGSVEAILGALKQLPQNEVQVRVLYAAPGEISETDVDLAAASDAVLIGFNTTLAPGARQAADQAGVDVRDYNIIYKLLDDIQAAMEGLLEPELVEEALGQAEVRAVFPVGRGAVAGCYIQSGKMLRNSRLRVRRDGTVIYDGNLDSLKRMKEDVREVNAGYECGVGVDSFNAWVLGDVIEAYRMIAKRRTLSTK